jgi:hypothetical protein
MILRGLDRYLWAALCIGAYLLTWLVLWRMGKR